MNLGDVRVHKEGDPRTTKRAAWFVGDGYQMRGVYVGEELRDDGRLRDDLTVEGQGWDQSSWVDPEVFRSPRRAEINDDLFERDLELLESDMRPMSPCSGRKVNQLPFFVL